MARRTHKQRVLVRVCLISGARTKATAWDRFCRFLARML